MFDYHKELDNGLCLPVVDTSKYNCNSSDVIVTNDFFIRYNMLFEVINDLKNLLMGLDFKIINSENEETISLYNKLKNNIMLLSKMSFDSFVYLKMSELETYLQLWGENLDLLYDLNIYKISNDDYISTMNFFNDALMEVMSKQNKLVNISLPNTWLITSNGFLYNTQSSNHGDANFSKYYNYLTQRFLNNRMKFDQNLNNHLIPEMNNPLLISGKGYITTDLCNMFLEYPGYVNFNGKIFDKRYLKLIIGVLDIQLDYYRFLRKLNLYTDNPIKELEKIIRLTNNSYDDVLLRCCDVSKVIGSPNWIIVTSSQNYNNDFSKYVNNGWNMSYITPLIINREKGVVEEYSNNIMKIRQL